VTPIAVVAQGAISPLGEGEDGVAVGAAGEIPSTAIRRDEALVAAGLVHPHTARVRLETPAGTDRAAFLLERAARGLVAALERTLPDWRTRRVAVFVGTSGGGMPSLERVLARRAAGEAVPPGLARAALYDGPLAVLDAFFGPAWPRTQVLAACVSSTVAIGLACRALDAGDVDLAIAGGYDALTPFIATGFEALGATTSGTPRPFRRERDGMALGEGAALIALARSGDAPGPLGTVLGFGASSDAVHVTAPDREGRGLAAAARTALDDAGLAPDVIDLVSAHATSTPHNDAAETAALRAALGSEADRVAVHPFKAVIGHTLGAAGVLEVLAALSALRAGVAPAALGDGELEPGFTARLPPCNEPVKGRHALKLSAAFGGSNAVLVLGPPSTPGAPQRAVSPRRRARLLHEGAAVVEPDLALLAARTNLDDLRISRLDRASALVVTAVARALEAVPALGSTDPARVAVIVGTETGSLEANEVFDARRRERGARAVDPRRFPATSPNLPAGLCSIAFGFRGPSFAVEGGPRAAESARRVATALVAGGDADLAVAVLVDDVGAVAQDLFRFAELAVPRDGARATVYGA
jgi:3-oxoacyl-[acyl-carrier-protein] synthase-1/3-oxoacyl-[acyl-carrier-protein] synthase II